MDAFKRKHQCATIQLDFQLPQKFKLSFQTADQNNAFERPVMIHRAVLGSLERMIAILVESYGGKFPLWLSPRPVIVIPVSHNFDAYARSVQDTIRAALVHCDVDDSDLQLPKKVRNAETSHYNLILVVGGKEQDEGSVNVRKAGPDGNDVILATGEFLKQLLSKMAKYERDNIINVQ
jgi:threonyl-tRNA synthetase